jgi:D-tyrosyl-tRNA(Tyr) deacylase
MLALIQRVTEASVEVDGAIVGAIEGGLLALVGMEPGDTDAQIARMADRLLGYRVFEDGEGRMNLSLRDTGGGLLLVSQFTLAADTRSGMRASFTSAAPPRRLNPDSTNWSKPAANVMREGWKPAGSGHICPFVWSMTGRSPSFSDPDPRIRTAGRPPQRV